MKLTNLLYLYNKLLNDDFPVAIKRKTLKLNLNKKLVKKTLKVVQKFTSKPFKEARIEKTLQIQEYIEKMLHDNTHYRFASKKSAIEKRAALSAST